MKSGKESTIRGRAVNRTSANKILPVMAWKGILRNGNVYFPYLIAGIFSVFTYFVFTSILHNDIIKVLPRSSYAWMMLYMGKGILSLILILFLVYANSFLVKRRQKEFGLYHILGLEKKHIGIMLFFETFLLYAGAVAGGVLFGMVLSKLLFLMLLRMCNLSVDVRFVFYPAAFRETIVYFLWVFGVNFAVGLLQVGKARPIELMSGSKKGEKEPRFLPVYALAGMAALVFGYYCSVTSKLDSMIFLNFVLAVSLVIVGTYLLFASGSIAFLKWMKGRKKFYYKPGNFVTISGMLYRMKKNAAGLSNICIFSTMVIITLICTVSLHLGMDSLVHFVHPYDMTVLYGEEKAAEEEVAQEIAALEEKYGLAAKRVDIYDRMRLAVRKEGDRFVMRQDNGGFSDRAEDYKLEIITTPEYERIENRPADLQDNEVLLHCSGRDYGYDSVDFMGVKLQVKEELTSFFPYPKAADNAFGACYVMVVKDRQVQEQCVRAWAEANGVTDMEAFLESDYRFIGIVLAGEDAQKNAFLGEFAQWCQSRPGFFDLTDNVEGRRDLRTMYGALLFLGILFGLIFFMCLILIMYYKQITEGYEDRNSFDIMQKVGMSDREIRGTVRRQILMVFGLPLAGAVMHTAAGMVMVKGLMGAVSFFRVDLLFWCTVGVIVIFMAVYGISYMMTAKTYYRIVRHE